MSSPPRVESCALFFVMVIVILSRDVDVLEGDVPLSVVLLRCEREGEY